MDRDDKIILYTSIAVLLVIIGLGAYQFGLFSITNIETKTINAGNHNYSVTTYFGESGYQCKVKGQPVQYTIHEDASSASTLHIIGGIPNGGRYNCGAATLQIQVRLEDMNLQDYEIVRIHRDVLMRSSAQGGIEYTADLNGITERLQRKDDDTAELSRQLGLITITNDGNTITIKADEGTKTYDARKPLYYEHQMIMSANDPQGGELQYRITSVEAKKRRISTASVPAPSLGSELISVPGYEQPIPIMGPEQQNLWQQIIDWIKNLF